MHSTGSVIALVVAALVLNPGPASTYDIDTHKALGLQAVVVPSSYRPSLSLSSTGLGADPIPRRPGRALVVRLAQK